jgi:YYY domain-containing protein
MSDFLRWLLVIEAIGIAFLPLTVWLCRWLPDRGFVAAKLSGLLGLTYLVWLAALAVPIAQSWFLPAGITVGVGAVSWWRWHRETITALHDLTRLIAAEELLFLAALISWTLVRLYLLHPGIGHTEQYMDLTMMQGSLRSASYPPYDPWMSGHAINYYYFGYLMYATLVKLSGVAPAVGYNLALSAVFAFTVAGAFSVAYNLSRRLAWATLGPLFVAVIGNWHAVLVQLPGGYLPQSGWFWDSTRVLGTTFINGRIALNFDPPTINEFPFFSFILGDLHPHVMALPVTILVSTLGLNLLFSPAPLALGWDNGVVDRLALTAIACGSLYAINSWDFPTYFLVVAACLLANAYLTDASPGWWRVPLISIPALGAAAVAAFAPFYLTFKSPANGIGRVTTVSSFSDVLQLLGLFLGIAAILLVSYSLLYQPAEGTGDAVQPDERDRPALEAGSARTDTYLLFGAIGAATLILGIRFGIWTLLILLLLAGAALVALYRVLNTEEPNRADAMALILIIAGCLALAFPEVFYLRDQFDGGANYRMNTVFKFYYQAWTLLGLAGAYGAFRAWRILREHISVALGAAVLALIAAGTAAGAVYTVAAPQTMTWSGTETSLDGTSILRQTNPDDAAAAAWLTAHATGNPIILEASGVKEYLDGADYSRVATFTGLPTVMGWVGHEIQWRGPMPEIGQRSADVTSIYTTPNVGTATSLLHKYGVRYVYVGETEDQLPGAHVQKFARFMHPVYRGGSVTIYGW